MAFNEGRVRTGRDATSKSSPSALKESVYQTDSYSGVDEERERVQTIRKRTGETARAARAASEGITSGRSPVLLKDARTIESAIADTTAGRVVTTAVRDAREVATGRARTGTPTSTRASRSPLATRTPDRGPATTPDRGAPPGSGAPPPGPGAGGGAPPGPAPAPPPGPPPGPPPPEGGPVYWRFTGTPFALPRERNMAKFPTSSKVRVQTGTVPGLCDPPERVREQNGTVHRDAPIDLDYCVPPSHLVFTFSTDRDKLHIGNGSTSKKAKQSAVPRVFGNWYNRAYNTLLDERTPANNSRGWMRARVLGVSWEGARNAKDVKRNPSAYGQIPLTTHGMVDVYTNTYLLDKMDIQWGEQLMWHPIPCGIWWETFGPTFETCLIGPYRESDYQMVVRPARPQHVITAKRMGTTGFDDPQEVYYNPDGPQDTNRGYMIGAFPTNVPYTDNTNGTPVLDMSRINMKATSGNDALYRSYLKMVTGDPNFSPDSRPDWAAYFKYMSKLGLSPYGLDSTKSGGLSGEQKSRLDNAILMGAGLAAHMNLQGGRKMQRDADGMYNWTFQPDKYWAQVFHQIVVNGIDPENAEFLVPDFDVLMASIRNNADGETQRLVQEATAKGILTQNGDHWHLNLVHYDERDPDSKNFVELLQQKADGEAKYVFAASIAAYTKAVQMGVNPNMNPNSPTAYTWDVVFQLAEMLKTARESQSDKYDAAIAKLTAIANTTSDTTTADELKEQLEQILPREAVSKAAEDLLKTNFIQVPVGRDGVTEGDLQKGIEKVNEFDKEMQEAMRDMGLEYVPGHPIENFERLQEKYVGALGDDKAFNTPRNLNLFVKAYSGERLTGEEQNQIRHMNATLREKGIDTETMYQYIQRYMELLSDTDVQAFNANHGNLFTGIDHAHQSMVQDFTQGINKYIDTTKKVIRDHFILSQYLDSIKNGTLTSANESVLAYLPLAISNMDLYEIEANDPMTAFELTMYATMGVLQNVVEDTPIPAGDQSGFSTYGEWIYDLSAFSPWYTDAKIDMDFFGSKHQSRERQMCTLLIHTVACSYLLRGASSYQDYTRISKKFGAADGNTSANLNAAVLVRVQEGEDMATIVKDVEANLEGAGLLRGEKLKNPTTTVDLGTYTLYEFDIPPVNFTTYISVLTDIRKTLKHARLCEKGYLKKIKDVSDGIAKWKAGVAAKFAQDMDESITDKASLQEFSKVVGEAAQPPIGVFVVEADKYLPRPCMYGEENITAPMHCMDAAWTLMQYGGASLVNVTKATLAADILACNIDGMTTETMNVLNDPRNTKLRVLNTVHAHGSCLNLFLFECFRNKDTTDEQKRRVDTVFLTALSDVKYHSEVKRLPSAAHADTAMEIGAKVLSRDVMAQRLQSIRVSSLQIKSHMLAGVQHGATRGILLAHHHEGLKKANTALKLAPSRDGMKYETPTYPVYMHTNARDDRYTNARQVYMTNPRERVFATYYGHTRNVVRMYLNPALGIAGAVHVA